LPPAAVVPSLLERRSPYLRRDEIDSADPKAHRTRSQSIG
jgi:hypothetical protein